MERKVILYIATSLDGFIAKTNNDLSFLNRVAKEGEDYGYTQFTESIDTVVMGRKTYDWVMTQVDTFPHNDKNTFIVTRTAKPNIGNIQFYTQSLKDLVLKLKSENGEHIFIDGGAEIVNELLKDNLIDEFIISIIPILVGSGTRLFNNNNPEISLKLIDSKHFEKGLVQLHYVKN